MVGIQKVETDNFWETALGYTTGLALLVSSLSALFWFLLHW